MVPVKDRLRDLIPAMMPSRKDQILKFHDDHADEIRVAKGSSHNHQYWSGGYHDHIRQCLVLAAGQYKSLSGYTATGIPGYAPHVFDLGFTLENAATVLYFHDIEKIFKYGLQQVRYCEKLLKDKDIWYYGILPEKYGMWFEPKELNALEYVHGEHDYSKEERKMGPLAAFCHMVDIASARIFFDVRQLSVE